MPAQSHALERAIDFFEHLTPEDCQRMNAIYSENATFKDPFNHVQGVAKIGPIFAEMFTAMHDPRFTVLTAVEQGNEAFITWNYTFRVKKFKPEVTQTIHGASHLIFATDGRIAAHRDYWDAAEELYAKLPIVGALMRFLQRSFAHHD